MITPAAVEVIEKSSVSSSGQNEDEHFSHDTSKSPQ